MLRPAFALLTLAAALAGGPALAQTAPAPAAAPHAPPPAPPYGRPITLAEARTAAAAAEAEARKQGWSMVIVVVEPSGALVLSEKMDGAQYGSNDVARRKAETSANFRRPTAYFQEAVKGGTLNSIFTGALAIDGGELLIVDGKIAGAIGVSGGSGVQDGQVARVAAAALK
ncbi:glcG protein [Caulobacter sp. Root1455]|uniref:GlcG/HbpS family heme-binding protein n=1 Tax=unclassified Caulobacter TaxID=2648921 RepID=UPI0006F83134|nr:MULTISPECIES: heme-binding protein [unclassified Caulobacter]KQY30155.1 glcG protein [Caulobacter sp. Root487D2Y]KQY92455.1 glcG protein [Caulobacter sp. Root1455]